MKLIGLKPIRLLVTLYSEGFSVIRYPAKTRLPKITVEQQAMDPASGLVCQGSALSSLVRALNEALEEATGFVDALQFNEAAKRKENKDGK